MTKYVPTKPENTLMAKYIKNDDAQQLIHYLESMREFDRYYISLALDMDYKEFNIKYYYDLFSEAEKIAIYQYVNEKFYSNKLKLIV